MVRSLAKKITATRTAVKALLHQSPRRLATLKRATRAKGRRAADTEPALPVRALATKDSLERSAMLMTHATESLTLLVPAVHRTSLSAQESAAGPATFQPLPLMALAAKAECLMCVAFVMALL
jgi:hypothetical protein